MFAYIKGILTWVTDGQVVVESAGIGYQIHTPSRHALFPFPLGSEIKVYVALIIREDAHTLYGFPEEQERTLFEKLISVTGIGPKLGLALLSGLTPAALCHAISTKDEKALHKVSGVGKKMAERLLLELSDKLLGFYPHLPAADDKTNPLQRDAMSALINLGFSPNEAQKAVDKAFLTLGKETDLTQILAQAIKLRSYKA
jgi:Holliday junction DNA helicase, RuvA subunit